MSKKTKLCGMMMES